AIEEAHAREMKVIGLLGRDGGRSASLCDIALTVESNDTQRIQETHNLIGHIICELVELILFRRTSRKRSSVNPVSIYDDDLRPLELDCVSTYPLASRPSKVTVKDFASPISEPSSLHDFLKSLPNILAVRSLRKLARRIRIAREIEKPVIWGIGGHVVKTGMSPVIIDLMRRGFVNAIAANGSVLVHDAEIALVGSTSEDVG